MIHFEKFTLANGLRVIVHENHTLSRAVLNVLYDVGARDEHPERTGFAHLFEHLMFGGSKNIPSYDTELQKAGGENNAFTTNDITDYFISLPSQQIETAFWLESDRMLELAFSEESLRVQRMVVSEEFKQRYLNQPYGDVWLKLRPLAYKVHPYQWDTIGKNLSHIEDASLDSVKDFFYRYYAPNNAIAVVAGDVTLKKVKELSEKWFGEIPKRNVPERNLSIEPKQKEYRETEIRAEVPHHALYRAYHVPERTNEKFYAVDLLSSILSFGKSSIFYQRIVKEKQLATTIDAYLIGSTDPGLFIIQAKLSPGKRMDELEKEIDKIIGQFQNKPVSETELQKVKNQIEMHTALERMELLNVALNLAVSENFGDADMVNTEIEKYRAVTAEQIMQSAKDYLRRENCSTLYYLPKR